jgi:hypothetical protein
VLKGLEDEYQHWGLSGRFADHVTLISAVSGGATGSMFYLNLYGPTQQSFRSDDLDGLVDMASQSSLDDVAWALVYNDLPRILNPLGNNRPDRGNILEETWKKRCAEVGKRKMCASVSDPLSSWQAGVADGWRPAAIFNSTVAETGEPLVLSTTAWRSSKDTPPKRRSFYDLYPGQDLSVASAVRIAASFPYVSPAARPDTPALDADHMIDGGYYDNYGVASLIAWLDEGLVGLQPECAADAAAKIKPETCRQTILPKILVLQIRSFPADQEPPPKKRGWFFQLYAPVEGLLSVRTTAQWVRDHEELAMFARRWEPAAAESPAARIQFAKFEIGAYWPAEKAQATDPPLSWQMNPAQIKAIGDDWKRRVDKPEPAGNDPNINAVHCFFDPSFSGCAGRSNKVQ